MVALSRIGVNSRKALAELDWVTVGCIVGKSDTRTSSKVSVAQLYEQYNRKS